MNRDDIIRMAREAGFVVDELSKHYQPNCITHTYYLVDELLDRFAALVAAEKDRQIAFLKDSHDAIRELAYRTGAEEEREACARVCEDTILTTTLADRDYNLGCLDCVKAIRTRGEK